MTADQTIQEQVDELNEEGREMGELGRPITLFVKKVARTLPLRNRDHRRRVTVILVEVNKVEAQELVEHLTTRIQEGLPGAISFVLYGVVVL